MSGALLEIAAPASECSFLLGNETTFWRTRYCRHTAFAIESCRLDFRDDVRFDSQASVVLPRTGDLVYKCCLQITLTKRDNRFPRSSGAFYPAEALIRRCSVMINGTVVESHTGDWLRLYDSLHRPMEESSHYRKMTNFDGKTIATGLHSTETLYLPLCFSFNKHSALALPMILLYNSEVKIVFDFASAAEVGVLPDYFTACLFADYVYLDANERRALRDDPPTYLIEQVQTIGRTLTEGPSESGMTTARIRLDFAHPIKSLYWVLKSTRRPSATRSYHGRYVGDEDGLYVSFQPNQFDIAGGYGLIDVQSEKYAPVHTAKVTINGVDRMCERPGSYYSVVQPGEYTKRSPLPGIYMYSFALHPEELAPSGFCDMSNVQGELILRLKQSTPESVYKNTFAGLGAERFAKNITELRDLQVFAMNYNLLTVHDGVADTLFGTYT